MNAERHRARSGTTRLVLICHGSTDAVRQAKFPSDEPLDESGLKRAQALAVSLPKADRCWTSPEVRARQTAEALNLNAEVQPILRECDYGEWTGRAFDQVHARDPVAVSEWLCDATLAPHGGESIFTLMQRVKEFLATELPHHRQVIVVTHATIVRAAIVLAIKATPHSFWRIDIAPLSITKLSGVHNRWNLSAAGCTMTRR